MPQKSLSVLGDMKRREIINKMNMKKEGSYVLNCLIQRSEKDNLENVVLFEQVGDEIITML